MVTTDGQNGNFVAFTIMTFWNNKQFAAVPWSSLYQDFTVLFWPFFILQPFLLLDPDVPGSWNFSPFPMKRYHHRWVLQLSATTWIFLVTLYVCHHSGDVQLQPVLFHSANFTNSTTNHQRWHQWYKVHISHLLYRVLMTVGKLPNFRLVFFFFPFIREDKYLLCLK